LPHFTEALRSRPLAAGDYAHSIRSRRAVFDRAAFRLTAFLQQFAKPSADFTTIEDKSPRSRIFTTESRA
jgi:hypothetical protein